MICRLLKLSIKTGLGSGAKTLIYTASEHFWNEIVNLIGIMQAEMH